MADNDTTPHAALTPGTPYFNLTPALQAFYAARGMWINGEPCSMLAGLLGPRVPWPSSTGVGFWVSCDQITGLIQDLAANGRLGLSGQRVGQAIRRLREQARRYGKPAAAAVGTVQQPAFALPPPPFAPLLCPPTGTRARKAFEHHVMQCLREVITFSQGSTY